MLMVHPAPLDMYSLKGIAVTPTVHDLSVTFFNDTGYIFMTACIDETNLHSTLVLSAVYQDVKITDDLCKTMNIRYTSCSFRQCKIYIMEQFHENNLINKSNTK